jgi:hypothetical protein
MHALSINSCARRSWSLVIAACQGGTFTIGGGLALETSLKAPTGNESSIDAFDILVVFPPPHNVLISRNIVID